MANRVVAVALHAEIGQYVAGMSKAAASTAALGDTVSNTTRRAGGGLGSIGTAGMVAGGLVAAGLGMAISKSMEFESAMSAVSAATGATSSSLAELRDTAMRAGAATQYSATEAAGAITEMSKAGVSAADIMGGGLDGALALAAAGQIEVADAAEIASAAMVQFGLSGEDIPHVADLLAAGAGKAMGSVEDLGQALNQAGLIADASGLSIEETTGGLAAFANAGLIGSDAGTSFKTMLQALQAPSGKAAELMEQLGLDMYDTNGNMLGLSDMAGQLQDRLSGLTEEQRNSALATIFGSDAVRAANVLYREGQGGIDEWTRQVNDSGYAAEQAAKQQDNLAGDLEKLGGAFDTLMISIGSGAQEPLRELTQTLASIVDSASGVLGFFGDLPGEAQLAIAAFGTWAVAGGQITSMLGPLRTGSKGFFDTFNEAAGYARANGDGLTTVFRSMGDAAGDAAKGGLARLGRAIGPELALAAATYVISDIVGDIIAIGNTGDDARKVIDDLRDSLEGADNGTRFEATNQGLDDLRDKAAAAQSILDEYNDESYIYQITIGQFEGPDVDEIRNAQDAVDLYNEAIDEQRAAQERTEDSTRLLGRRYNISAEEVRNFADSHGIDLSGSLQIVQGDFMRLADAAELGSAGIAGISAATDTGYENLATYAGALGLSDDAMEELRKHTDELGQGLAGFAEPLSTYTGLIDAKKQAEQESAQATADATEDQSDSWEDYVGDVSVSIDEYLAQLEEQVAAQDAWQTNMLTLAGRVSQGTIDELARMGPEGAPLVAQLVDASDGELARLETVFGQRSADAASEFGEQLYLAAPVLAQIASTAGQGVVESLAAELAAGTTTVGQIAAQYGITLADGINPVLTSLGKGRIAIAGRLSGVNGGPLPAGGHADGGAIHGPGSGTSDSIPAMLSNGEFVIRASSVDKYGLSLLNNINQGRAMFAAGGFVSTSDVPRPSSTAPFGSPISTGADATMQAGYEATIAMLGSAVESAASIGPATTAAGGKGIGGGWQSIFNVVKAAIPQARQNSTYRPGDPGYHGRGKAVDFGFGSGPGGAGSAGLASINRFLYDNYGSKLAELIYDGVGDDRADIKNGKGHTYNAATRAQHANHVHAAVYRDGGLVGTMSNPHIRDAGGPLLPGYTFNGTGRNEMVLPSSSREFSGSSSFGGGVQATTVNISGAEITGTLQMGGDGLMRIVDGRIVSAVTDLNQMFTAGGVR